MSRLHPPFRSLAAVLPVGSARARLGWAAAVAAGWLAGAVTLAAAPVPWIEPREPVPLGYGPWLRWGGLALAGLVLLGGLGWWLRRRQRRRSLPPPPPDPYAEARAALERARTLLDPARADAFAVAVSQVLRRYLEGRFTLPAPELTTEEFLQEMVRHDWLRGELGQSLQDFLTSCDLVKFARQGLTAGRMRELFEGAERFLRQAEDVHLRQAAAAAAAAANPSPAAPALSAPAGSGGHSTPAPSAAPGAGPRAMPALLFLPLGQAGWWNWPENLHFRLAEPGWLWLLLLLPLLAWLKGRAGRPGAIRFSSAALAARVAGVSRGRAGRWLAGLRLLAAALVIAALARPQFGQGTQEIETSGIDIVLALDLSGSMWAHDFELRGERVDRLTVVKSVVGDFIRQRPNDRIGLVAFATDPYLVSPLTLNHEWLGQNLERLHIGSIDPNRTAIGSALAMSANRLRQLRAQSRIVILLTDGENNSGTIGPAAAAEAAAAFGIKVYTIAAGREGLVPVPVMGEDGQPARDRFGRVILRTQPSNVDVAALREIAEKTGGKFYRAEDTRELAAIYQEIDRLEKTEVKMRLHTFYEEAYALPLGLAAALLLLETVLAQTRYRRVP